MSVLQILTSKFPYSLLSTFRNGWFDDSGSKLYAYSISHARAEEFQYYVSSITDGYGYVGPSRDDERFRIPVDNNCYRYKQLPQLIEEGIFTWVVIEFIGIIYQNDWYCRRSFTFYEHGSLETISEKVESKFRNNSLFFTGGFFDTVPALRDELDTKKISEMLSTELGEPIDFHKDFEKIQKWLKERPGVRLPVKPTANFPMYRDFIGMPSLVAEEKIEIKRRLNQAYEVYMNEEILYPLASALNRLQSERFKEIYTVSNGGGMYQLIYPNSKKYLIGTFPYLNQYNKELIFYFVYLADKKEIYEWILPDPKNQVESFFGFVVKEEFEKWLPTGYELDTDDPAVTLDDENFWIEYVFKKGSGNYLYLRPVDVKNPQPDIYTRW